MLTVVLYHNIADHIPSFEAQLDVSTRRELFLEHIEYYQRNYDIVDLDAVLQGPLPRNALLITFDDYYRSVLEVASSVLHPKGIPAVFFVNPGLLGEELVSLDTALYRFATAHGLPALCNSLHLPVERFSRTGDLLSGPVAALSAAERSALRDRLLMGDGRVDADREKRSPSLQPEDLARLPSLGVEIGNHTATHVHCRSLEPDEHVAEIVEAKRKLEALSRSRVRSFSLPYGDEQDATPAVLQTLRDSGHEAIFLVHARSNLYRKAPDIWYRVSMHNEPLGTLFRRLSVLPLVRSARNLAFG